MHEKSAAPACHLCEINKIQTVLASQIPGILAELEGMRLQRSAYHTDWMICQEYLNNLLSYFVNGEDTFSSRLPEITESERFRKHAQYWPERMSMPPRATASFASPFTDLVRSLSNADINLPTLVRALLDAQDLLQVPPQNLLTICEEYRLPRWRPGRRTDQVIHRATRLMRNLRGVRIVIHGSRADDSYTEFSDTDATVILGPESWATVNSMVDTLAMLHEVGVSLQQADPLQHHGYTVLLEHDLRCLPPGMLPSVVFRNAVALRHQTFLTVNRLWSPVSGLISLCKALAEINDHLRNVAANTLTLYELKELVSMVSLLPALLFQIQDVQVTKKEGIARAQDVLTEKAVPALKWATQIRSRWPTPLPPPVQMWLFKMACINQEFPAPRLTMEAWAAAQSPVLTGQEIPFLDDATLGSLWSLVECGFSHLARGLQRLRVHRSADLSSLRETMVSNV